MHCPFCQAEDIKVIDSRACEGGRAIRRRRECLHCSKRFTTYERIEQPNRLLVIKKSGDRVPFDRNKVLAGLELACHKRPVSDEEMLRIVDEVEEEVHGQFDREVPSTFIGQSVAERLRRVDQVAYVRFASVYRQFKTLEELVDEAKAVLDARRYEDSPGQGRLFVDPAGSESTGAAEGSPRAQTNGRRAVAPSADEPAADAKAKRRPRPTPAVHTSAE